MDYPEMGLKLESKDKDFMHKAKFVVLSTLFGDYMWDKVEEILSGKMLEEKQVEIEAELRDDEFLNYYKATEDVIDLNYLWLDDPEVYDKPADIGCCLAEIFIGTEFSLSYTITNPFFTGGDDFVFRDGGCDFDGKTLTNTVYDIPREKEVSRIVRTIVWEVKDGDLVKVSSDSYDEE